MTIQDAFRSFVDRVNTGRWDELAQYVPQAGRVTYNKRDYPGAEFLARMQERIGALPDGAFEVETAVGDEDAQVVAVRIVWRTNPPQGDEDFGSLSGLEGIVLGGPAGAGVSRRRRLTGVHHLFCWLKDGQVSDIETIGDIDGIFQDDDATGSDTSSTPSTPSSHQQNPLSKLQMSENYHAYLGSISKGDDEDDIEILRYCHPTVLSNNRRLTIPEYRRNVGDVQQAIPDIKTTVQALIADEAAQVLAVRLEFTGVPIGRWAGVEPSGRSVCFSEHAFYWLDGGRIYKVLNLLDLAAYREQMRGLELRPQPMVKKS